MTKLLDINLEITTIIQFITNKIGEIFTFMQSIKFLGTDLLTFIITITIISAMLPILLTLLKRDRVERAGREIGKRRESDK